MTMIDDYGIVLVNRTTSFIILLKNGIYRFEKTGWDPRDDMGEPIYHPWKESQKESLVDYVNHTESALWQTNNLSKRKSNIT
jgi:hypothetical protein